MRKQIKFDSFFLVKVKNIDILFKAHCQILFELESIIKFLFYFILFSLKFFILFYSKFRQKYKYTL